MSLSRLQGCFSVVSLTFPSVSDMMDMVTDSYQRLLKAGGTMKE